MFKTRLWLLTLCSFLLFTLNEVSAQQFTKAHAVQYLQENLTEFGLQPADISEMEVTDNITDDNTGVTHIYLRQNYQGVPVREGVGSVHILKGGKVTYHTNNYIANLADKVTNTKANLSPEAALRAAANVLDLNITAELETIANHRKNKENVVVFTPGNISRRDIPVRTYYEFNDAGALRLIHEVEIYLLKEEHWWLVRIDAATGKEINRNDIILHCSFGGAEHVDHEHYHLYAAVPKEKEPLANMQIAREETAPVTTTNNPDLVGSYNHFGLITTPVNGSEPFYAMIESPIHGDRQVYTGEQLVNLEASPLGWHNDGAQTYTITEGNNCVAFHNPRGTLVADPTTAFIIEPFVVQEEGVAFGPTPTNVPDGGSNREFLFNSTFENNPVYNQWLGDAITNLFVGNNVMHDVTYLYSFNEQWGNYQTNNFGNGGVDNDHVFAGAQANAFVNNASFGPGTDGDNGQMKMYIWDTDAPNSIIDGDFDAGVIAHEYGHGVSTRMVGGPSSSCLSGSEQGGEGWSDFEGLMITQKDFNDNGTYDRTEPGEGIRGIGNYVLNQGPYEEGIRLAPYTTNMDPNAPGFNGVFNDYTYGQQPDVAAPHGVGFIWCTMLWDLNWELIDKYGFEWDIYKHDSEAGNIRLMKIVHEAFKYTGCGPSFIDMRDAIFQANEVLYPEDAPGDNMMFWEVFARRGLGVSATAGGNEAFDLPTYAVSKSVSSLESPKGSELFYTINVKNNSMATLEDVVITDNLDPRLTFTGSNDGATENNQTVTFPSFDVPVNQTIGRSFSAQIDPNTDHTSSLQLRDLEDGPAPAGFTAIGLWQLVSDETHSGEAAYFHPDAEVTNVGDLTYDVAIPDGANAFSFWQRLDTESGFDGGVLDISYDGGLSYEDLGPRMIKNPYNSAVNNALTGASPTLINGREMFSGVKPYFQTVVDFTGISGNVTIRWRFGADANTGQVGWWIDDIEFLNLNTIPNEACATTSSFIGSQCANIGTLGTIIRDEQFQAPLAVDIIDLTANADQSAIRLNWITANESNNRGFEILRRAEGEEEFSSIAYIKGRGDNNTEERYTYLDKDVNDNTRYYYQLRAYEFSGKSALTNVVSAMIDANITSVEVYPNPASNNVSISVNGNNLTDNVFVEILNATGQLVRQLNVSNTEASNISVDVSDLPQQLYLIRITSGDFVNTQQVMIQR